MYYLDLTEQEAIDLNNIVFNKLIYVNSEFVLPAQPGTDSFIDVSVLAQVIDATISYYMATALSSSNLTQIEKDLVASIWNNRKTQEEMIALGKLPPPHVWE